LLLVITLALGMEMQNAALAGVLDKKGEASARQANLLFRQGRYEDAAPVYAQLLVDYPSMVSFYRNLGACYYYLNRPEPALSNLRQYLSRREKVAPRDKAVVDGWIVEMERLRARRQEDGSSAGPGAIVVPPVSPGPPEPTVVVGPPNPDVSQPPRPLTPAAGEVGGSPAAVVLAKPIAPLAPVDDGRPFYRTWLFWSGVGAVVLAGTATAFLIPRTTVSAACEPTSRACIGVK